MADKANLVSDDYIEKSYGKTLIWAHRVFLAIPDTLNVWKRDANLSNLRKMVKLYKWSF